MAADADTAPGLGEQFGRTKASFSRLLRAHVALARAEIGEIIGQLKLLATLAGIALGLALLVLNLLYIGGFLFIGEWLFGSMGWGLAHGVLLGLALIVVLLLAILGASPRSAIIGLLVATALTVGVALLLATNVAYDTTAYFAQQLAPPFDSAGLVAAGVGAIVGAVVFGLLGARAGGQGGAVGGVIVGLLMGAIVGWLMGGAPWTKRPAVGLAIVLGLVTWPIVSVALAWPELDPGARFAKFVPRQSIDAANETRAWMEEQWRVRRPTLGRK
jgi:MFS family permease